MPAGSRRPTVTAQPTFDFGYGPDNAFLFLGLWTGIDNPFMPASIRNDAVTNPDGLGNPTASRSFGVMVNQPRPAPTCRSLRRYSFRTSTGTP